MAIVNTTRDFFDECDSICSALEAMTSWTAEESERVQLVQLPILRRFRQVLDEADSVIDGGV